MSQFVNISQKKYQKKKKVILLLLFVMLTLVLVKKVVIPTIDMLVYANSSAKEDEGQTNTSTNNKYDVIVFGGDPEGISAAVSAARSGASVLLLSYESGLGGLMTYGLLNSIDMNLDEVSTMVTQGIFKEFYDQLDGDSFDVNDAWQIFSTMVKNEENITYISNAKLRKVIMENETVKGVSVGINNTVQIYYADRIIDATQDGDLAALAGAPYTYGAEDIGLKDEAMAATLVFKVQNVDWEELKLELEEREENGQTNEGINDVSAWGFGDIAKEYTTLHDNMRIRGLNIGKQNDGTILINALQIIGLNGLDDEAVEEALREGKEEAENITKFLQENIKAFKNCTFVGIAPELYIRETRHIEGEYTLTVEDVLSNADFKDKIAIGSYPMDVQTTALDNYGFVIGKGDKYAIPLRCLVPKKIDNIFIVGRSASYTSLAASSARTIPVGMCTGEAAGVAAVYSIKNSITPRSMCYNDRMIKGIQKILLNQGAYLTASTSGHANSNSFAYNDVMKLISKRLIFQGYTRRGIDLTQTIKTQKFVDIIMEYLSRINSERYNKDRYPQLYKYSEDKNLTSTDIAEIALLLVNNIRRSDLEAYKFAESIDALTEEFWANTQGKTNEVVTCEVAYNAAVYIIEELVGELK